MELTLLQQIQNQVAAQWYYSDWFTMPIYSQNTHWPQVAEIYARNLANEKVREDRAETTNEAYYDIHKDDHVVSCKVLNRPLPFPDEQ